MVICNNGLYLIGAKELIPLQKIEKDEHGFYVVIAKESEIRPYSGPVCMNNHPIYHDACNGCANWLCNFRCKCHSPWAL